MSQVCFLVDCYMLISACCAFILLSLHNAENARRKDAVPPQAGSGVANLGIMRMFGLAKSSKVVGHQSLESRADKQKKLKVSIYEESLRFGESFNIIYTIT